jgi:hypothetical protein
MDNIIRIDDKWYRPEKGVITIKSTRPSVVKLAKELMEKLYTCSAEEFIDVHLAEIEKYELIPKVKINWLFKEAMRRAGYDD